MWEALAPHPSSASLKLSSQCLVENTTLSFLSLPSVSGDANSVADRGLYAKYVLSHAKLCGSHTVCRSEWRRGCTVFQHHTGWVCQAHSHGSNVTAVNRALFSACKKVYLGTFWLSVSIFVCFYIVVLLPWWTSVCLLLPVIISKIYFVVTCVSACVCVCARRRTKGWWKSPCVSCYTQVQAHLWSCSCVSAPAPCFRGPEWSNRRTCRDLLSAELGYFRTVGLLWDELQKEAPLQSRLICFLFFFLCQVGVTAQSI